MSNIDDDHVTLLLDISGKDVHGTKTKAFYSTTKTQPILKNPANYHCFVERFDIPGYNLPCILFDPANPGTVTLEYNGDIQSADLVWIPRSNAELGADDYYWVYNPTHYLDMINIAFNTAFAALAAPPAGSNPPKITFNQTLNKFQLFTEKAYYDLALANPITIRFNNPLYYRFPFWDYDAVGFPHNWLIQVEDYLTNRETIGGVNYLTVTDDDYVGGYWSPVQSVVFTTNLPIRSSYTDFDAIGPSDTSNTNTQPILSDFKINPKFVRDQQTTILFIPQTSIGILDMVTNDPLKKITLELYWQDYNGDIHPILLPIGFHAGVKLLFVRKGSSGIA